jgi:diguanylate cyclase (GGDEF)-like protein
MSRYRLIRALLLLAVALMAAAVWGTGRIQASAEENASAAIQAGQQMLIAMIDQETGLRGYINTRDRRFLEPYTNGRRDFDAALTTIGNRGAAAADRQLLREQVAVAREWQALAETELARIDSGDKPSTSDALERKAVMDRFRAANAAYVSKKQRDRAHDESNARTLAVVVIVVLGTFFVGVGWFAIERPARREARRRRRLAEFSDALQVTRSEREAFDVLKRHLEGWLDQARATVLIRNASANRLQAATGLDQTPVLAERLDGATPESCLAVRLAKPYSRTTADHGLLRCEICGELPAASTCMPTIVGGQVVGSVLVQTPRRLEEHEDEDLEVSVRTAGPVIANLRNLAVAELRAATDVLTGLANHRAVQDTLNRMVAQAGRTKTELAAIIFDLDHFKRINDLHGHAKGDEVLAGVGQAVAGTVRESDFVGRYGGEEFVAFLPDTSRAGALVAAEKLRAAIAALEVPGLEGVSASFGVAVLPTDALTGELLMRAADRALYAAKQRGRNRVETAGSGERRPEPAERG